MFSVVISASSPGPPIKDVCQKMIALVKGRTQARESFEGEKKNITSIQGPLGQRTINIKNLIPLLSQDLRSLAEYDNHTRQAVEPHRLEACSHRWGSYSYKSFHIC
jgi:hypothetical protein